MFQQCANGHPVFIPAPTCRLCLSGVLTWQRSAGRGRIYSWSTVWRPPSPQFQVPYAAAIVVLDEGYSMLANIIGCDHESLVVDMAVGVEFHAIGGDLFLPYFSPIDLLPDESGTL